MNTTTTEFGFLLKMMTTDENHIIEKRRCRIILSICLNSCIKLSHCHMKKRVKINFCNKKSFPGLVVLSPNIIGVTISVFTKSYKRKILLTESMITYDII